MCGRPRRIDGRTICRETLVELRQPLGVDECLEDTKYFNHVFLATQSAHEAKVGYLVQMRVHLVDDSRLIAAIESSVGMISTVKSNAYSKETFPYSTPRVNSKCASSDPGG